ncbi:MAG: hypothetical protein BWX51_01649 [Bacteroidetes bacterium ADurb.Bin012]|jgi:hypothetical protein|nr:MAG: hypothetical protein BWX51_01649 [Bacteroidetes bacterium ADurb.Bin012]
MFEFLIIFRSVTGSLNNTKVEPKKMKKFGLLIFVILIGISFKAVSEDNADSTRSWKLNGNSTLTFNQLHFSNWAEGGESSLSGSGWLNVKVGHYWKKLNSERNLILGLGVLRTQERDLRKTEDKIDYTSIFGYKAFKNWNYTSLINFKSQFTNGYRYPDDSTLISTFMAPGYLTLSLGMQYKPSDNFTIFISPASGRFTFVLNEQLANKGSFGVKPAVYSNDSLHTLLTTGKKIKPEFGINVNAQLKREIFTNVSIESRLILYNNYLDEDIHNRWNIDVNWDALINFHINKFLSSSLRLNLLYDHNIKIKQYAEVDGHQVVIGEGPRLQFKESFGIGLNYKF